VTLNLAIHELVANAAKHGALSTPSGRVDVVWALEAGEQAINIDWRESGGPGMAAPSHRGFGTRLVEQGLAHELGAESVLQYPPGGATCTIRLPLSSKVALAV
jgi:two-component sensor histidine kinase